MGFRGPKAVAGGPSGAGNRKQIQRRCNDDVMCWEVTRVCCQQTSLKVELGENPRCRGNLRMAVAPQSYHTNPVR